MPFPTTHPGVTRRTFLRTAGASAAGMAGVALVPQLAWAKPPPITTVVTRLGAAAHSQTVVQRFGMNIQPGFNNEYSNSAALKALLQELGVRKVRTLVQTGDPNKVMPYLADLHTTLGITVHGAAGAFPLNDAQRTAMPKKRIAMAANITKYAAMFESIGGYNEPNGTRFGSAPTYWLSETLNHQKWMWNLVHGSGANPALDHIAVCGPSLHDQVPTLQQDYMRCDVMRPYMERINMHRYPSGLVPSSLIDDRTGWAAAGMGSMPVVVSEGAYNNGMRSDAYAPVPLDIIGTYADRLLMEHVERGNDFYWFELLNNYPPNSTDKQNFYGLVTVPSNNPSTWTPMPAFRTFQRMLAMMNDGDGAFSPAPLPVTVTGPSDMKCSLVGKRDGSYLLALWRDVSLWDRKTRTQLTASPLPATVSFGSSKVVNVYQPSVNDTARATSSGTDHTLSMGGTLQLLSISA